MGGGGNFIVHNGLILHVELLNMLTSYVFSGVKWSKMLTSLGKLHDSASPDLLQVNERDRRGGQGKRREVKREGEEWERDRSKGRERKNK